MFRTKDKAQNHKASCTCHLIMCLLVISTVTEELGTRLRLITSRAGRQEVEVVENIALE